MCSLTPASTSKSESTMAGPKTSWESWCRDLPCGVPGARERAVERPALPKADCGHLRPASSELESSPGWEESRNGHWQMPPAELVFYFLEQRVVGRSPGAPGKAQPCRTDGPFLGLPCRKPVPDAPSGNVLPGSVACGPYQRAACPLAPRLT